MFGRGDDVVLIKALFAPPLQPEDIGHTHARDKVRIFAITLFHPSPSRILRQPKHGAVRLMETQGASLAGTDGSHRFDQLRIPR